LQEKDSWKSELKEFSSKNGYDLNRNGDAPVLLDVLEGFLKFEVSRLHSSCHRAVFLSGLSRLYCVVVMMGFGSYNNVIKDGISCSFIWFCLIEPKLNLFVHILVFFWSS
jgi:hypothetical protein